MDDALRSVAHAAARRFGLDDFELELKSTTDNEVFELLVRDRPAPNRYALRLQWYDGDDLDTLSAELVWLDALRRDTDLAVPRPVAAPDGALVVEIPDPRHGEGRPCSLLEWVDGESIDIGLTPQHLRKVGALMATLHEHSAAHAARLGLDPRRQAFHGRPGMFADPGTCAAHGFDASTAGAVTQALSRIRTATAALDRDPSRYGFIHADLHQWNYLFHRGEARAIDFEDCGWGHFAYDIAVTLSYFRFPLPGYAIEAPFPAARDAFLAGYAGVRPVPAHHETTIDAFMVLRLLAMGSFMVELEATPTRFPEARAYLDRLPGRLRGWLDGDDASPG